MHCNKEDKMSGENLIDATVSNCSFFIIISSLNVKSKVHIF